MNNRDRRYDPQQRQEAGGRVNGQTNVTLHYHDAESLQRPPKENCCIKFYNCIKGSASYRDMKVRTTRPGFLERGMINSVSQIDTLARYLFPFVFLLFNVVYWIAYLDQEDISPSNYVKP